ncbi:protein obstructor-E-like [Pollicipes pollicipes]|uniref:protein obstructor-E-like n=1 Tax=Pollicipes pollicipes TaxID=41117 RepID=UPI0018858F50|nr:protein obstructor-E-like [Pollicipes pollicipes]
MALRLVIVLPALLASAAGQITSCEYSEGLQTYPDPYSCDSYFKCANGTLTQERCENGLLFSGIGAVHDNCDYFWRVECGDRPFELSAARDWRLPLTASACFRPATGARLLRQGLAYDEVSHSCNWPDLLPECSPGDAEQLVGYSCPDKIPAGSASLRFGPFPRFVTGQCDRLVTCVNYFPRLTVCPLGKAVDEASLTCVDAELVPGCGYAK